MDKHLQVRYLGLELGHKLALHSEHTKKTSLFEIFICSISIFPIFKSQNNIEFSGITNLRKQITRLLGLGNLSLHRHFFFGRGFGCQAPVLELT